MALRLWKRVAGIKLVSYTDSSDDDDLELIQPTPISDLVSLDTNSNAVIKPVPCVIKPVEEGICVMKRASIGGSSVLLKVVDSGIIRDVLVCQSSKPNLRSTFVLNVLRTISLRHYLT